MERMDVCSESQNMNAGGENIWCEIVNTERVGNEEGAGPEATANMRPAININTPVMDVNDATFIPGDCQPSETIVITSVLDDSTGSQNMDADQDCSSNLSNAQEMLDSEDDGGDTDADERKSKDKFNTDCLSYELQVGYRILGSLMSASNRCVNKLFLYPVDNAFPETSNYYEKIKKPMWMFKMKEKFETQEYKDLTEFMSDFRLMIENCYRFNGPDNFVSKKAQKLEMIMKQKVALLSRDLREKITGSSSTNPEDDILASAGLRRRVRNPNALPDDPSQQLLTQLRRDREMQERVGRRQKVEDRKAMEQARIQELQEWEDKLVGPEVKDQMKTMWELPQIGLFVYLCMESLGLEEEVTQYHIERGLAVPRECSDFKRLMTCLLSTPHQRKNLKSFMPYPVWNEKLTKKLDYFYKVLSDKHGNQTETCFILGLDTRAFKVMGKSNPLLKKQFHQLSYLKRVWILKNFCDFCMETQPYLQKTIDDIEAVRPMDVREVLLGYDGRGNRYINFPMFTGKDIRIYKHPKFPEPSLESLNLKDWSRETEKPSTSSSRCSTPVNQKNNRVAETPSLSLRAKALIQAAESKEASPMRDTWTEAEAPKSSASSPLPKSSPASDITSSAKRGKQTSSKKRKWPNIIFSKRKRFKAGSKKTASDDSKDMDRPEELDGESCPNDEERCINFATAEQVTENDSINRVVSCDKMIATARSGSSASKAFENGTSSGSSVKESGEETPSSLLTTASDNNGYAFSKLQGSPDSGACAVEEHSSKQFCDLEHTGYSETKNTGNGHLKVSEIAVKSEINCERYKFSEDLPRDVDDSDAMSAQILNGHADRQTENIISGTRLIPDRKKMFPEVKQKPSSFDNNILLDSAKDTKTVLKEECKNLKTEVLDHETSIKSEFSDKVNYGCHVERNGIMNEKHEAVADASAKIEASNSVMSVEEVKGAEAADDLHYSSNSYFSSSNLCLNGMSKEGDFSVKQDGGVKEDTEESIKREEDEESDEDSDEEELPDLGRIELVAESMEEIRQLVSKISNPEPTKRGKRVIPGIIKSCEQELVAAVSRFHDELSRYERSLGNARVEMQTKLRKDVESYVEAKVEETKGWESDHSHGSKDSTDDEDSDGRAETDGSKKQKKGRQKPLTPALLSSAASKLSSATGEGNEDSSDSFELDISSRGRLRKRRIIPNNTEDTGLKKRKNLPNQDSFFSAVSTAPAVITATTAGTAQMTLTTAITGYSTAGQMSTLANCAIRAQLAAQATKGPGQIVRLVAPTSDGALKTLHLGKPNVILSPQNLSNIRFISSTAVVSAPRSKVLTSSPAQSAHPVIQQLLLNHARSSVTSALTTTVLTEKTSSGLLGQPLKHLSGAAATVSAGKSCLAITSPSSVNAIPRAKPSIIMTSNSSAPVAVVVTQVSTSVSQGGKQVLDIGSLSASQLQQLMKNQAIHINTGAGGPTTLLFTSGLQHLASAQADGASSLVAMIKKPLRPSVPQVSPINKQGPLLTLTRQVSPQILRPIVSTAQPQTLNSVKINTLSTAQTAVSLNQVLNTAALQTTITRTMSLVLPQIASVSKSPSSLDVINVTSVTLTQKPIPSPRIISSLAPTRLGRVTLGTGSIAADQKQAANSSFVPSVNKQWTMTPDTLKSKIITVPLVHLSPSKKYANNVTVKALLENRGTKKEEADVVGEQHQSLTSSVSDAAPESDMVLSRGILHSVPGDSSLESDVRESSKSTSHRIGEAPLANSLVVENFQTSVNIAGESFTSSGVSRQADIETKQFLSTKLSHNAIAPLTLPISVDTAIQSITASPGNTSEIILPTVNIKVPSPNTLPSVQHNKNGTTIVQSTKVPIPMTSEAKTGDSLSPSAATASVSHPQVTTLQNVRTSARVQPAANNVVVLPGKNTAVRTVSANPVPTEKSSQLMSSVSGLKNVTLKLMPQASGSGHVVQGFMTSRGLVIPQAALLQQSHQGGNIMLNNVAYPGTITQLQPNPVQIQRSSLSLEASNGNHNQQLQQHHLTNNVIVAAPSSVAPSSLSQSTTPSLKVVLQKAPYVPTINPVITAATLSDQQTTITTPASELVKQIASNSQLISNSQKTLINPKAIRPGSSQQSTVQLLNLVQNSGLQPSSSSTILNGLSSQNTVSAPTSVSHQLTPQILSLQQNSQLQRQPNIVLAAKTKLNQGAEIKPSTITLQVQQMGQLISNIGGVTQLQLGGMYPGQQTQQQLSPRIAQPNQILQLGISQPSGGQGVLTVPQPSHVVHISGPVSPQLQQRNQGMAPIQPHGNIVIQQQTLLPQQAIQGVILPQANLSQSGIGSSIVQPNSVQLHIGSLQQPLNKLPHNPIPRAQASAANKVQLGTGGLIQDQQLLSTTQAPSLVTSQIHIPRVSQASASVNQTQVHFVVNPTATSLPALSVGNISAASSSVNKIQVDSLTGTDNISRVIRADSSLVPAGLSSYGTGILGLPATLPSSNQSGHAVVTSSASSLATRSGTQVIITNSRTGQLMIAPVRPPNSQAAIINPVSFVSAVHTQSSELGQTSSALVNCSVPATTLAGHPSQVPARPAVIYAGQPLVVSDKKEGKIAQLLLAQPGVTSAQVIANNQAASTAKLQPNVPAVNIGTNMSSSSDLKMLLYKIGDQYFSPAGSIQQISQAASLPANVLAAPGVASAVSKPDVQLLVPPAFIEASDQILKHGTSSIASHTNLAQVPSSAIVSHGTVSGVTSIGNPELSQGGQKTRSNPAVISGSNILNNSQSLGSVNGVYQGPGQFSFSLSSPSYAVNTQLAGPVNSSDGALVVATEVVSNPVIGKNNGSYLQSYESLLSIQNQQHPANSGVSSAGKVVQDRVSARRNTFSDGQHVLGGAKGPSQRHLSADDSALTLEERDEKEAALNLLTLANQI